MSPSTSILSISFIYFLIASFLQKLRPSKVEGWQGGGFCRVVELVRGGYVTNGATLSSFCLFSDQMNGCCGLMKYSMLVQITKIRLLIKNKIAKLPKFIFITIHYNETVGLVQFYMYLFLIIKKGSNLFVSMHLHCSIIFMILSD